jgi:hypothetical protein
MKIDQLIVQYLYQNKKVILQDIGTFSVAEDIIIPTDIEKDTVLPENAFQFKYDPKAGVDEGLINYIIENTRKIRPLATSDLESFVILNKQFLNIGKPLVLEGLGTLQKVNDGSYTFSQSNTSHVVLKEAPKVVTEKLIEKISFATPDKQVSEGKGKWLLYGLFGFLLVGGAGATGYYFITKEKSKTDDTAVVANKENAKTEKTDTNTTDTTTKLNPVSSVTTVVNTRDSNAFYIVIKEYQDLFMAKKRLEKLVSYGNKLVLTTKDSITYKMKMPFKLPLSDTLRVRDSLNLFFQAKTYVEIP